MTNAPKHTPTLEEDKAAHPLTYAAEEQPPMSAFASLGDYREAQLIAVGNVSRRLEEINSALVEALDAVLDELNHAYRGMGSLPENHPAFAVFKSACDTLKLARGE